MKLKLVSIASILLLTLMACQGVDNSQGTNNNPNVDPTTYPNNTGDGMVGDRDHMMERDADRYQNRDNDGNNRMNNENNNESRYEIAEEAAEKITKEIDEIEHAYVLTTDDNAYVAANLDADNRDENRNNMNNNRNNNRNGDKLTDDVKEEIGKIVQSVDRDIDNVYVSTNPDFFDLANNYSEDLDNGEPVEGFFDQIGNMIERLFPENTRN